MKKSRSGNLHFIKLDKGEELIASITAFANEVGIKSGFLTGIGVLKNAEIGYFDVKKAQYDIKKLDGEFELLSLMGNVGITDGKISPYLHVVLGNNEFQCLGGHLLKGYIGITCELILAATDMRLERIYDPDTKLKLLTPIHEGN